MPSWRERFRPGSFRGARFHIDKHDADVAGRRVAVHEYPGKDRPYTEDLGHITREFSFNAFVIGRNYYPARDALIAACGAAGPGTLIHPYLPAVRVVCKACRLTESTVEGNMAKFELTFVDSGENTQPTVTPNHTALIGAAAANARTALASAFVDAWSV